MKYTAERLAPIVASASSFTDLMRKLGLEPNGGNHRLITARIRQAGLDTSHFRKRWRETIDAIPRAQLETLVSECRSVAAVLAKLGFSVDGRCHKELSRRLRELAIDIPFSRPGLVARPDGRQACLAREDPRRQDVSRRRCLRRERSVSQRTEPGKKARCEGMVLSVRNLRDRGVVRQTTGASPRPHQRNPQRSTPRESPAALPELPFANGDLLHWRS